ncbi:RNA polymerase sigma factor [Agrobacterium sp. NPDC089420]|uniref:RNA polymerase sigma factor n=1 Tax=Agrobacterium sp. NPDC089420 TaxID=3363918 RepID=UPI00384DAD66
MVDDPDADLLKEVAAGDSRAMQALVTAKLPRIMALATRMLGDRAEAEDIAQETFLRIWKQAGSWQRDRAKFDTWIHRVALNLCYDRLRKPREIPVSEPPEQIDTGPLPDGSAAVDGGDGNIVAHALQAISARQREAIVLVYYQEMSNREAAEIMHISVDALESLLARGRRALSTILKGQEQ